MNRVMVDLETLGLTPGSIILSIGAVCFDGHGLGPTWYSAIDIADQFRKSMTQDPSTMAWWGKQNATARAVFFECANAPTLEQVLRGFSEWLSLQDPLDNIEIWGNGAAFDNALLEAAYRFAAVPVPWKFYNNRCYRTLKGLRPGIQLTRVGTFHNALDDAMTQAEHAVRILKELNPWTEKPSYSDSNSYNEMPPASPLDTADGSASTTDSTEPSATSPSARHGKMSLLG